MNFRGVLATVVLSTIGALLFAGPAQADDPAFRVSPSSYDFGDRVIGEEYGENDMIFVSPTSDADVVITGMEIVGPDAEDFDFSLSTDSCYGQPLSEYACDIYLSFISDDEVGMKTASIEITSNAVPAVKTIPLLARVVEPAENGPALLPLAPQPAYAGEQGDDLSVYPNGMNVADFNDDGRVDVASAGQKTFDFDAAVAFGQADGTFSAPLALGTGGGGPWSVVIGDFDGQNGPDILVPANAANIYLNDGEGGFTTGLAIGTNGGGFASPGDFNGDGDLDVAIIGYDSAEIFLNNGDATFAKTDEDIAIDGFVMGATQTEADFDGTTGTGDFAVTTDEGRVLAFLSDGDGTFTAAPAVRPRGCGCTGLWGISATDLNRDGRSDLSVAGFPFDEYSFTLLGQSSGSLVVGQVSPIPLADGWPANGKGIGNGDLNGDGIPEQLVTDYTADYLTISTGLASGLGFAFASQIPTTDQFFSSSHVATGDINGDGKQDVILGGESGLVIPIINVGEPNPVAEPESVDFGTVVAGSASEPETVTLTNEDGAIAPLVVSEIDTAGGFSEEFAIGDTDCLDAPILVGASCSVEVTFDPDSPVSEVETTDLTFTTNSTESEFVSVALTGTVEAATFGLSADPTSLQFGDATVGGSAQVRSVRVTNDGNVTTTLGLTTLEGAQAGDYSLDDGCDDGLLGPGDFCTIQVTFEPGALGARIASVSVPSEYLEDPLVIPVSGTGVPKPIPAPGISLQPGNLGFPETEVGSESGTQDVTITSSGTAPLSLGAITPTGAGAGSFAVDAGACADRTLAVGSKCVVSVRFKPTAAGAVSSTLTISANLTGRTPGVPLAGTGILTPAPKVSFKKKPKKKYVIKTKKLKKVKIAFKADQSGSKFQCRIDKKKFSACKSPKVFKNLKPGKHVIKVRAKKAGKTGPAKVVKFKVVRKKK